ncbi:FkbM family methyltransferase [bacterium]|nr:FkbM family methyltransferase [bacterium]
MHLTRKRKNLIKKITPRFLKRFLIDIYRIFFDSHNAGNRVKSFYSYLKWHLYNKPFNKITHASLINGYRIIIHPDSDSGVADIYYPREWHNLTFIRNNLPERAFIIDAGCNIGNRTLTLADKISGALMIDANELSLTRLKENFELNKVNLDNYHIVNAALGDKPGEVFFTDFGGTSTQNKIINDFNPDPNTKAIKVRMTTIDEEMRRTGNPECHFIKTDVEGYDLQALRGAVNTIKNNPIRLIMFEKWKTVPIEDFISFFSYLNWRIFAIDDKFNKIYSRDIIEYKRNLFAEPGL